MFNFNLILNYLLLSLVPSFGYSFKCRPFTISSKKYLLTSPHLNGRNRALTLQYKKAQLVAFEINTAPSSNITNSGKIQTYVGKEDAFEDLQARVNLAGQALAKAAIQIQDYKSDSDVLKVFLLPEFFFRGNKGAYPVETILGNRRGMDRVKDNMCLPGVDDKDLKLSLQYLLANLVKGEDWKDWLFVFGTVLGCKELSSNQVIEGTAKELAAVKCFDISSTLIENAKILEVQSGLEIPTAAQKFITVANNINKPELANSISTAVTEIEKEAKALLPQSDSSTVIDYPGLKNEDAKKILSSESIGETRKRLLEVCKELEDAEQFFYEQTKWPEEDKKFNSAKDNMLKAVRSAKSVLYQAAIENDYEIFNVALVQKGGWDLPSPPGTPEPFAPPNSFSVIKASVSDIDFIRYINAKNFDYLTYDNSQNLKEGNTPEKLRSTIEVVGNPNILDKLYIEDDNVFLVDDIVVGVEICLDHSKGVLKKFKEERINDSKRDSPKNVQIQILTSCGMDLIPNNILIREGLDTLAFSCDGLNSKYDKPLTKDGVIPSDNGDNSSDNGGANSRASVWNKELQKKYLTYDKSPPSTIPIVTEEMAFNGNDKQWTDLYNTNCDFPRIRIFQPVEIPGAGTN